MKYREFTTRSNDSGHLSFGNMLAEWSCWNDEVTPPEQNIWRAGVNRKNGTWNRETDVLKWFEAFLSNPVLSGAACKTSFFVAACQPIPFSLCEIGAVFRIHKPQPNGIITIFWGKFPSENPFHKGILRMVKITSCQAATAAVAAAAATSSTPKRERKASTLGSAQLEELRVLNLYSYMAIYVLSP